MCRPVFKSGSTNGNERTRYKTYWAMVIAERPSKKKEPNGSRLGLSRAVVEVRRGRPYGRSVAGGTDYFRWRACPNSGACVLI